jgi:hypothetical protein
MACIIAQYATLQKKDREGLFQDVDFIKQKREFEEKIENLQKDLEKERYQQTTYSKFNSAVSQKPEILQNRKKNLKKSKKNKGMNKRGF